MTKEMRPSHRIDVLSSALVYYGIKKKEKLGEFNKKPTVSLSYYDIMVFSFVTSCTLGSYYEGQDPCWGNVSRIDAHFFPW